MLESYDSELFLYDLNVHIKSQKHDLGQYLKNYYDFQECFKDILFENPKSYLDMTLLLFNSFNFNKNDYVS